MNVLHLMDKEKKGIFGNFEIMNYQKIKICVLGYSILKTQFKPSSILHIVHILKKIRVLINDKSFCGDFIPFGFILNQSTC